MYYFDNYSVNTYKTVHKTRLIGVFCWKLLEWVKKYLYVLMKNDIYRNGNST